MLSHRVVPSSLLEFLCDTLELRTVLLRAHVPSEAALALRDDLFDFFVELLYVPDDLELVNAYGVAT